MAEAPALEGAVRFLEGAGARGALELVADEILELLRSGTQPERIAVVVPTLEQWRATLETAFGTLEIPFSFEGRLRLGQTAFGHALLSALRFVWREPERRACGQSGVETQMCQEWSKPMPSSKNLATFSRC